MAFLLGAEPFGHYAPLPRMMIGLVAALVMATVVVITTFIAPIPRTPAYIMELCRPSKIYGTCVSLKGELSSTLQNPSEAVVGVPGLLLGRIPERS